MWFLSKQTFTGRYDRRMAAGGKYFKLNEATEYVLLTK
jgi:hypothetical protein